MVAAIAAATPKVCFCGVFPRLRMDDNERYWLVQCRECGRASIHCRTREEAVEAWNENPG